MPVTAGDDVNAVGHFSRSDIQWLAVDLVHDGPQQRVGGQHEQRPHDGLDHQPRAAARAHRSRAPQRGGCIEAAHIAFFAHDDAGTQKADARHHIRHHPHRTLRTKQRGGHVDKNRCAQRHQHIGAQPGGALAVLALHANQAAQHKSRRQADQGVKQRGIVKGLNRWHRPVIVPSNQRSFLRALGAVA